MRTDSQAPKTLDAKAVANYFLARGWEQGEEISPMKLQKLLYYAHGWNLALNNKPLISETVEAWPWGPVVRSIYDEFKSFGNQPITKLATEMDWSTFEDKPVLLPHDRDETDLRPLLDRVWEIYKPFTAIQLSSMTHRSGTPWSKTIEKFGGTVPKHAEIPNDLIRECFLANQC